MPRIRFSINLVMLFGFFVIFSCNAVGLYPQSLANAIHVYDIQGSSGLLYKKADSFSVICHPVDKEFFIWMFNSKGSPEEASQYGSLFSENFCEGGSHYPVFSINVRNNGESRVELKSVEVTIDCLPAYLLLMREGSMFQVDYVTIDGGSECRFFAFSTSTDVSLKRPLETFRISVKGLDFDFEANSAWDFLKRDIIKYQVF